MRQALDATAQLPLQLKYTKQLHPPYQVPALVHGHRNIPHDKFDLQDLEVNFFFKCQKHLLEE